jgi:hypothetical protein
VSNHQDLFARIHPRKGLRLKRWSPMVARQIDLLVGLNLIDWHFGVDHPRGLMHLTLTDRGRRLYYKYRKTA